LGIGICFDRLGKTTCAVRYYKKFLKLKPNSKNAPDVECRLETGRTHQIRAHLSHIGHPLLGDGKYGINRNEKKQGYKYQALYAFRLHFAFSDEECSLSYLKDKTIELPTDKIWFLKDFE